MAKSADQKLKLICLLQFFEEETDEEHPASMKDILEYLESRGVHAERKSIYDDIDALNRLDYEILFSKSSPSGYYLAQRDFELPELKLLVDAVTSSKFITQKKSMELIRKLEKQTSTYNAKTLNRQVYTTNRVKTINEGVLYSIDAIHDALSNNRQISFHYCEWNRKKELVWKNDGKIYRVDPIALLWDDENYYLVAFELKEGKAASEYTDDDIRHYRVDKIQDLEILSERRFCKTRIANFKIEDYTKKHFGMFSGKQETVKLFFEDKMIGVMLDRFGTEIPIMPGDREGWLSTRVQAMISDLFFGWVAGFRGKVRIGSPEVAENYRRFLEDTMNSI